MKTITHRVPEENDRVRDVKRKGTIQGTREAGWRGRDYEETDLVYVQWDGDGSYETEIETYRLHWDTKKRVWVIDEGL